MLIYLYQYCHWDERRLRQYRSDNGYRLHLENHVSDVEVGPVPDTTYRYIRSSCVPETRQNDNPYVTWILVNDDGQIQSGGCSCVADDGTCKHCVALIFSLSSFSDRHRDRFTEACTDQECKWDKPKKTSMPMEIDDIDLRKDQSSDAPIVPIPTNYVPTSVTIPIRDIEKEVYSLMKNSNAVLLHILVPPSDDSDIDDVNEPNLPTLKDVLPQLNRKLPIIPQLQEIYTHKLIIEIENKTRGQAENEEWFLHRMGRLTASLFSSVLHFRFPQKGNNHILRQIMEGNSNLRTPAIQYGKINETVARQMYYENVRKLHKRLELKDCGLWVDEHCPFMGASPDGLVKCKCCGVGLLEIKCSYTFQNKTPEEASQDPHYHLYLDENSEVKLKMSSPWYVQIQGQMGVCKMPWCDFVFYTRKGLTYERIYFDPELYKQITSKCIQFFEKYVL